MPINKIKHTEIKTLYPIVVSRSKKVVTPNYFNIINCLADEERTLLNFLIKECTVYNTVKYSTRLLEKYREYAKVLNKNYPPIKKINTNVKYTRSVFIKLLEKGLIFRADADYVMSFTLVYSPQYAKQANEWMKRYDKIRELKIWGAFMYALNRETLNEIRK